MSADSPIEAEKLIELANWLRMMGEDCGVHSADRDRLLQSSSALQHLSSQVEGLKGESEANARAAFAFGQEYAREGRDIAEARAQASARLLEGVEELLTEFRDFAKSGKHYAYPLGSMQQLSSLLVLIERGKRSSSVDEIVGSACGATASPLSDGGEA